MILWVKSLKKTKMKNPNQNQNPQGKSFQDAYSHQGFVWFDTTGNTCAFVHGTALHSVLFPVYVELFPEPGQVIWDGTTDI